MRSKYWIEEIVADAIDNRVSDIHLEPKKDKLNVRCRIDGMLYQVDILPVEAKEQVISRIKVLSQIDITITHSPQDGQFEFNHRNKTYNIRVSSTPTIYGEAMVMRILNRDDFLIQLCNLGFDKEQLRIVNKLIASPYGMILNTGPCGSGKTTLLYSILNTLMNINNNIITVEDPVELQIPEIRQIQVNEAIGLNFPKVMRGILRQDPNIIMVGEIRDSETAQMAIQAALTGILVFSTFHTLDVPALIIRLIEMGIPRSVIGHAIAGVISSRLIRKICPTCEKSYNLSEAEKKIISGAENKIIHLTKGTGCSLCRNSGYSGRVGIFEVIYFDEEIRNHILEKDSIIGLQTIIRNKKIKSLREMALQQVIQGITTIEEVVRVVGNLI